MTVSVDWPQRVALVALVALARSYADVNAMADRPHATRATVARAAVAPVASSVR